MVSVRVFDPSGVSVYNHDLGMNLNGTLPVPLGEMASGIYIVELTFGDQKVFKRLIKN